MDSPPEVLPQLTATVQFLPREECSKEADPGGQRHASTPDNDPTLLVDRCLLLSQGVPNDRFEVCDMRLSMAPCGHVELGLQTAERCHDRGAHIAANGATVTVLLGIERLHVEVGSVVV
jgi:hypothetical protein